MIQPESFTQRGELKKKIMREKERERERERGVAAPEKKASGGVSESHIKASVICKIGITTPRLIRPSVGLDSTSALKPAFMFAEGCRFA